MRLAAQRLAGLWPWLFTAALQVALGHAGLEAAATRALIKVTLLNNPKATVSPFILEGVFAGSSSGFAEGKLMQSHPLSLCNTSEDERQESFFISIVKLESPESKVPQCLPLLEKARLALNRGAQAVIFDITDDLNAAFELNSGILKKPVVMVKAAVAEELMGLVNKNEEAKVEINIMMETPKWTHYEVGILLTVVSVVLAIIMIFALRSRCRSNRTWDSAHQQTMRAISRLETRTYSSQGCSGGSHHPRGGLESNSSSSSGPMCAICLEEFLEGQDLRIISCAHEFHKECVDPWLLQHRTCPLCMHNIMGAESSGRLPQRVRGHPPPEHSQAFLHRHPQQYPASHAFPQHPIPFSLRPHYPRTLSGPYPQLSAYGGSSPYHARLLSTSCSYHLAPDGHRARPRHNCRNVGHHYTTSRRPCYHCHANRTRHQNHHQTQHLGGSQGRQDEGSCSGASYGTERSGYFPDGPGSDSSSGPCHGSSSDSVLNCTDVSLQGVYGSCSTFRSSLSSEFDPFVYHNAGAEGPTGSTRPRSLDSEVNQTNGGLGFEEPQQQQTVFSHVHYHRHRHHYYEDGEASQGPGRGSDEEQETSCVAAGNSAMTKDSTFCQGPHVACHCPKTDPVDMCGPPGGVEDREAAVPPSPSSSLPVTQVVIPASACCHPGHTHCQKKNSCSLEASVPPMPAVHFHQRVDLQDDCSIHIHYGQSPAGFCCPSTLGAASTLLPVPVILDSSGRAEWPCCRGARRGWQKQGQQAHSEPQLIGTGTVLDTPLCRGHHSAGHELPPEICIYCQSVRNNQGSEEESGV